MSWESARIALDTQMLTLSGLDPNLVAWSGRTFIPPTSGVWYRVDLIPAAVDAGLGIGADKHERGIYQVSVYVLPGNGNGALTRAIDAVVALFDRKVLSGISTGVPVPGPIIPEPDWLQQPVSIPFVHL